MIDNHIAGTQTESDHRQKASSLCQRPVSWLWQVLDSNQRRLQPTILQTAPFGRSGNLPCRVEFHPAAGRNNTQLWGVRANHLQGG